VRRLAAVLAVALVTLGATACGSAKPVSVAQVERSFAKHHQTFETEGLRLREGRAERAGSRAGADRDVQPGSTDSAAKPGFVVRQGNLIVAGSTSRWPGVQKALGDLR
jgi:hypothetical protein